MQPDSPSGLASSSGQRQQTACWEATMEAELSTGVMLHCCPEPTFVVEGDQFVFFESLRGDKIGSWKPANSWTDSSARMDLKTDRAFFLSCLRST
ncbi:hypothetical protein NQZ68_030874 [Dissostichus eleginoides]|nr:hypothetical protein NQZ68_030874 [Dissostichus eleginoides]